MTFSPASRPIVATLPLVLVLAPPPLQTRFVSDQPGTLVSVIVLVPSWEAGKVKVTVLGRVGSASSSSEKPAVKPAGPLPVVVNAKSCASSGTASLVIVIVAFLVLV